LRYHSISQKPRGHLFFAAMGSAVARGDFAADAAGDERAAGSGPAAHPSASSSPGKRLHSTPELASCCGVQMSVLTPGRFRAKREKEVGKYPLGLVFRFSSDEGQALSAGEGDARGAMSATSSPQVADPDSPLQLRRKPPKSGPIVNVGTPGGLTFHGRPPMHRLRPDGSPVPDAQAGITAARPLPERCLKDLRPGDPERERIPTDRALLLLELDGVLLHCGLRRSGSKEPQAERPEESGCRACEVCLRGEERLLHVRPYVLEFLVRMKREAGLAIGIFTTNELEDALVKVQALESAIPGFHFDVVVHRDTQGAWDGRAKMVASVLAEGRGQNAFIVDCRGAELYQGAEENATFVERFVMADHSDKVFEALEFNDRVFRSWLVRAALPSTSFRVSLKKVDRAPSLPKKALARHAGDEDEEASPESVQRARSVVSFQGVNIEEKNGDNGHGVGLLPSLDEREATPTVGSRSRNDQQSTPKRSMTPRGLRFMRSPSNLSEVSMNSGMSNVSGASRKSRVSRIRDVISRKLSRRQVRPNFHGEWVCVDTWGLDDFLKENGIGKMQRMAASKAPWPSWERLGLPAFGLSPSVPAESRQLRLHQPQFHGRPS